MQLKRIKQSEIIKVLESEGFKRTTAQNVLNGDYGSLSPAPWRLGIDILKKYVCSDP